MKKINFIIFLFFLLLINLSYSAEPLNFFYGKWLCIQEVATGFTWKNEIWFICHIVSYENPRQYYHIICVFDKEMELLNYTYPFKFEGEPIEFCLSITIEKDKIIIPYSTWDKTTKLGIYDRSLIEKLFVN